MLDGRPKEGDNRALHGRLTAPKGSASLCRVALQAASEPTRAKEEDQRRIEERETDEQVPFVIGYRNRFGA
jgi:hypothetical protein